MAGGQAHTKTKGLQVSRILAREPASSSHDTADASQPPHKRLRGSKDTRWRLLSTLTFVKLSTSFKGL